MPKSAFIKTIFIIIWLFLGAFFFYKELVASPEKIATQTIKPQVLSETNQSSIEFTTPVANLTRQISPVVQIPQVAKPEGEYTINLPILMYHYIRGEISPLDTVAFNLSVTPEMLDKQLGYLHDQGFQTISLNDVYESLSQGTPLPPKAVVLTFDDGYRDFYTSAFPLLKKYNLRAVSFYVTGYTGYPGYMNWGMLKEVHNSGLVDIESHTVDHYQLTKLSQEDQRKEIFESKKTLEEGLGKKINFFAYPYGDLNSAVVDLVREAGYKLAFGTNPGVTLRRSEMLSLERISVVGSDTLEQFIKKVNPIQGPLPQAPKEQTATTSATPQTQ